MLAAPNSQAYRNNLDCDLDQGEPLETIVTTHVEQQMGNIPEPGTQKQRFGAIKFSTFKRPSFKGSEVQQQVHALTDGNLGGLVYKWCVANKQN